MELNNRPLKRATPEEKGVSSLRVLQALRALDATENEIHGVMIAVDGEVISESWPRPFDPSFPHTNHSMGKSWTCTAVGIACTQGLLSPEDRVADLFAEEFESYGVEISQGMREARLRDLMSMSCGMTGMPYFDDCWMENFLRYPIEKKPGTYFYYNSVGSCMLGALIEKRTGKTVEQYLREELLDRIGVGEKDLVWCRFGSGICAEPGTASTTEANLRLGLFYLARGFADGKQIISREWMDEATRKQVDTTPDPGTADAKVGYGWQLWMCRKPGVYRFDGGQGQFCLMDPEKRAVISLQEGGMHPNGVQKTLDILQDLLRDMTGKPMAPDTEAMRQLRDYENSRSLPVPETRPVPEGAVKLNGTYAVREGNANFWMEAFPGNVEFYHMFYDPSVTREIRYLNLCLEAGVLRVTVNGKSVFEVSLDGTLRAVSTAQVIPGMPMTCCHGYFTDENTVRFTVHWLNSWMAYDVVLRRDGLDLEITVSKSMRHEGKAPVIQKALARKIGF